MKQNEDVTYNVTKAFDQMKRQHSINIAKSFGVDTASSEDDNLQKSDIFTALEEENNIVITKTGADIKVKISSTLLPMREVQRIEAEKAIEELLPACGDAPTESVNLWWSKGVDLGIDKKVYTWDETCEDYADTVYNCINVKREYKNLPVTVDQALNRRRYNDQVRMLCTVLLDIKTCNALLKNLKDSEVIKLTPRQALVFGFDN